MNNPVIDLAIRIKNGYMAGREQIESPHSRFREDVLKKLVQLGYVKEYKISKGSIRQIIITLKYENGSVPFTDVKIYSKPGQRWYVAANKLKPVLGGLGVSILSTPQGILTNREAKKKNVGGELLFDIW